MKLKITTFQENKMVTLYEGNLNKDEIEFYQDNIKKIILLFSKDRAFNNTYKMSKEYIEIRDNELCYVIELKIKKTPKKYFRNLLN